MDTWNRRIHLRPRLQAAAEIVQSFACVADVGCDHGRLIAALLQEDEQMRGIASDVGAAPLLRAKQFAQKIGVFDRISFRLGDGLSVLKDGEADAICLLGMGGTLMARLLSDRKTKLAGAKLAVFQPMRAVADIRRYLYENGYRIVTDHVIFDAGRLYQVFAAEPLPEGCIDVLPNGWQADCFDVGYHAFRCREPLLGDLVQQQLSQHEKRLLRAAGTRGEALLKQKAAQMRGILRLLEEAT